MSVTVSRERPFKQVWFEAWPEDRERWSRGDGIRKSVPEANADHWEGTVADGTESCSSYSQKWWRWRPETTTVRVRDALKVVRQVQRRKTVQTTVNQHTDLEVDAFRRLQCYVCWILVGGYSSITEILFYNKKLKSNYWGFYTGERLYSLHGVKCKSKSNTATAVCT